MKAIIIMIILALLGMGTMTYKTNSSKPINKTQENTVRSVVVD